MNVRRPRSRAETFVWTIELAYALGLLATDGCLSGDGRHIAFVSADEELVRTLLRCIGRPHVRYVRTSSRIGRPVYRASVSHVALYAWLLERGLTPRKSLTLGALDVPPEYLPHVVRGLLDGDGSIYLRPQRPTRRTYPGYVYLRLWTYFSSASAAHVQWLRASLESALGIRGWVERTSRAGRHPYHRLRFGRRDSFVLLGALYADPTWPALERKRAKWSAAMAEHAVVPNHV